MFVKSRSDWYSLDWSGAEHYRYCCQWRRKHLFACVCIVGQYFKQFNCRQLKNRQVDVSQSVRNVFLCVMLIKQSYYIR